MNTKVGQIPLHQLQWFFYCGYSDILMGQQKDNISEICTEEKYTLILFQISKGSCVQFCDGIEVHHIHCDQGISLKIQT